MSNQTTLFIDTALQATCVGLFHHGVFYKNIIPEPRGAAERLLPMINDMLQQAHCAMADINTVITTIGPGSFTGLRVGLSVVQTLPLALNIKTYGLSTFDAIALSSHIKTSFCVLLESKRKDFYIQTYGDNTPYQTPQTAMADDITAAIHDMTITGDGSDRFIKTTLYDGNHHPCAIPDPESVITAYFDKNDCFTNDIAPLYLRDADVSFPKQAKL